MMSRRAVGTLPAITEFTEDLFPETSDESELFAAIKAKDCAAAERFLPMCDVNATDEAGTSPIHLAALNGDEAMLDLLILAGADLNLRNETDRETVLFKCASAGNLIATEAIIKAAAKHHVTLDINAKSSSGKTALYEAAQEGYEDIVDTLIKAGANVNLLCNRNLPIHTAISSNHHSTVKLLLQAGSFVNQSNNFTETPLITAARIGDVEMVKLLDEYSLESLDIDKPNLQGSPLMLALKSNRMGVVQQLLLMGANVNKKDRNGNLNPILFFAARGSLARVAFLIDNEADIESTNATGETPLVLAIKNDHLATVNLLIKSPSQI